MGDHNDIGRHTTIWDCPDCHGTGLEYYGAPCRTCRRGIGYAIQRRLNYTGVYLALWGLHPTDLWWPMRAIRALVVAG